MQCPASLKTHVSYGVVAGIVVADDEIKAVKSFICECAAAARGHCPHGITLLDIIASVHDRAAEVNRQVADQACTSQSCSWHRGDTDGVMASLTEPIHLHLYIRKRIADIASPKNSVWGSRRAWLNRCDFQPMTTETHAKLAAAKADRSTFPAFDAAARRLAIVARRHAWEEKDSWNGRVKRSAEVVIADRHRRGQRCRIGLDLWSGDSTAPEYEYWKDEPEWGEGPAGASGGSAAAAAE